MITAHENNLRYLCRCFISDNMETTLNDTSARVLFDGATITVRGKNYSDCHIQLTQLLYDHVTEPHR